MLTIDGLTKSYKGVNAVDHISLHVDSGDIHAFIGHNGAGKTTTIKAAAGILPFDEGVIRIDGHSIKEEPMYCKSVIAYLPDNPALYHHLTGIEYLDFVCDVFHITSLERKKLYQKYGEDFELSDHLKNPISSYSHGMKQKLAIISAFIHNPKLILMDEPFVGLDPKSTLMLKKYMKKSCDMGNAIFFSTHILEVAEKLCNKVTMINTGKIAFSGEMSSIIGDSSLETTFINSLN